MNTKVVFPSFRGEEYPSYEMRQLVSALELRFQSIEANTDLSVTGSETSDLDGRYSQLGHTHSESEITDLQNYLVNLTSESIFDLADVDGTPDLEDTLVWNGTAFVPGGAGAVTINLDDLTDVSVPVVEDDNILRFNDSSNLWEAEALTLDSLDDLDLAGGEQYDLLYNSDGTVWKDTDSLKWNPDGNYLQLANDHSINWLDSTPSFPVSIELLNFNVIGTSVPAGVGAIVANFEGVDGDRTYTGDDGRVWTFVGTPALNEITNDLVKWGNTSYAVGSKTGVPDDDGIHTDVTSESTEFTPGTRDWYVRYWMNSGGSQVGGNTFWAIGPITGTTRGIRGGVGNDTYDLAYAQNGSTAESVFPMFGTMSTTGWHEVVYERVGTDIYCYQDGVQNGSAFDCSTNSIADAMGASPHVMVGVDHSTDFNGTPEFSTRIDGFEMRIGQNIFGGVAPGSPSTSGPPVVGAESFTVGDPSFNTVIDGLTTTITSDDTDIDGTLDVSGAAIFNSTLLAVGLGTFNGGILAPSPVADTTTPILTLGTELADVDRRLINFWENLPSSPDGFFLNADFSPTTPSNRLVFGSDKPSGDAEVFTMGERGEITFNDGAFDYNSTGNITSSYSAGSGLTLDGDPGSTTTAAIHVLNTGLNLQRRIMHIKEFNTTGFYMDHDAVGSGVLNYLQFGSDSASGVESLSMSVDGIVSIDGGDFTFDPTPTDPTFTIFDAGQTDSGALSHDGTNFNFTFTNTADVAFTGITGNFWVRDGAGLKISNTGDNDFVVMSHDGTDFNEVFTNTTSLRLTGLTQIVSSAAGMTFSQAGALAVPPGSSQGTFWSHATGTSNTARFTNDELAEISLTSLLEWPMLFDSSTVAADPGAGEIRFNNVDPSLITELYFNDAIESDQDNAWILSNLATGDIISILNEWSETDYLVCSVSDVPTDNIGWWTVPVTVIHSGTLPTINDQLKVDVQWFSQSDKGGATVSGAYRFDTSTIEADPGNGDFRMDNATPASVTELFISSTTDNNNDLNNILSFVSAGDQIYIQQDNDASKYIFFNVTANVDNTGWFSMAGTTTASGTIFDGNRACHIVLLFGGSGGTTLDELSDVDVSGASQFDMLFKANGNWEDTAGAITWDGVDDFRIAATANPSLWIIDTDAGLDEKKYVHRNSGGFYELLAVNDAENTFSTVFSVNNVGGTVDEITVNTGTANTGTFRMVDATEADGVDWHHNGTEFRTTFNTLGTTSQWRIINLSGLMALEDASTFRVEGTSDSDYIEFSHDNTTAIVNVLGASSLAFTGGFGARAVFDGKLFTEVAGSPGGDITDYLQFRGDSSAAGGHFPAATNDNTASWPLHNVLSEFVYRFDSATAAADPGSGDLRFDNATPASVTNLYIDDLDLVDTDQDWMLSNLAVGDRITIREVNTGADYLIATIRSVPVDNTGWWTIPVTIDASGTIPTNNDCLAFSVQWLSQLGTVASEVVTTTNVILADESGTTFYLNTAGGFTSTLPAPAVGLKYRFIVSTAPTTAYIITTNAGANILYGTINEITTTAGISVQAQDTLNFVASTSLIGDWIEVESDGTNWHVHGVTQVDNGITASVT